MSDDETLGRLFRDARPAIVDDGFARQVMHRIDRLHRRRRIVLSCASLAGAVIAVPALSHAAHALSANTSWVHIASASAVNVAALCAYLLAMWVVSVSVEN